MASLIDLSAIFGGNNKNTSTSNKTSSSSSSNSIMNTINNAINNMVNNTQNGRVPTATPTTSTTNKNTSTSNKTTSSSNKTTNTTTNSAVNTINQAINNMVSNTQNGRVPTATPTTTTNKNTTSSTTNKNTTTTSTPKPSVYATPTATPTYVMPTETSHTTATQRQENAENFKNAVNAGATIVSSKDAAIHNANQAINNALGAGLNLGTLTQQPSATTLPTTLPTTNTTTTPTTTNKNTTTNKTTTPTISYVPDYDEGYGYVSGPAPITGGGGNSGGSSSSIYDQINEWYEAQKQLVINQIQHAMDQAIADYEKSIAGLDENYQPLRNQSEVERFKSEQALKEQLANSGNTYSGLGRQEALNLQNAFSNNIVDINNQQQNELEELQRAIQNVTSEGEFQKANAGLTYDANQLQSMIDQANLDREYEWNKYLQQYQEKQDSLAYDWQKYLQDYKESQNAIKGVTSGNSGTTSNKTSGSLVKHTATQAKNWLNSSLSSGDVYDGMDEDLDTYYSNYGSYPTDEMMDAFIDQVNEYIGGDGRHKDNYAKSLLTAWYGTGRLNDVQAAILGKMFNIEL